MSGADANPPPHAMRLHRREQQWGYPPGHKCTAFPSSKNTNKPMPAHIFADAAIHGCGDGQRLQAGGRQVLRGQAVVKGIQVVALVGRAAAQGDERGGVKGDDAQVAQAREGQQHADANCSGSRRGRGGGGGRRSLQLASAKPCCRCRAACRCPFTCPLLASCTTCRGGRASRSMRCLSGPTSTPTHPHHHTMPRRAAPRHTHLRRPWRCFWACT